MALDDNDKNWIKDAIVDALETIVLPRFDEHDRRFDVLEADVSELKDDVRVLKEDVHVLKNDMRQIKTSLQVLEGKVAALEADIKEVYLMQARLEKQQGGDKKFAKLSLEKKLLQLNEHLLQTAKEAGVALPR